MKEVLPINLANLIKTYSYHANISAILLDDKIEEEANVWFSNVKLDHTSEGNVWFERQISEFSSSGEIEVLNNIAITNRTSASCSNGDISSLNKNDDFRYIYSKIEGDSSIEISIDHIKNSGVWSKVGLMFREDISSDSKYVFIFATPSVNGICFQVRDSQCETPKLEYIDKSSFPIRLKIERVKDSVNLYYGRNPHNLKFFKEISFKSKNELYMGLAVCSSEENSYMNWYASDFIQIYCYKDFNMHSIPIDFYVGPHKDEFYSFCPLLNVQKINYSLIGKLDICIIDLIINAIDEGQYIDIELNEFYIPEREAYRKYPRIHSSMIYGYDSENKTFDLVGYTQGNIFGKSKVTFEEFEKALINDKEHELLLIKPHVYRSFSFNIESVKRQLNDYINASDSFSSFVTSRNYDPNMVYGVEVYDYLIKNIITNQIGIRPLNLIYEHKKLMLMRLNYMRKSGLISEDIFELLFPQFKSLMDLAYTTRQQYLKHILAYNIKLIKIIISNLESMKANELEWIPKLIDCLANEAPISN